MRILLVGINYAPELTGIVMEKILFKKIELWLVIVSLLFWGALGIAFCTSRSRQ